MEHQNNVVSVNCNAGKGRTGTSICCFLIYSGLAENYKNAITYYGWKRFVTGRGVSQPSQQRYIQYFERVFRRKVQSPSLKRIHKIEIITIPSSTGNSVKPCIEIADGKNFKMIWTNNPNYKEADKKQVQQINSNIQTYKVGQDDVMVIEIEDLKRPDQGVLVCGDLYFKLINAKNKDLICRFAMNTAFIPSDTNVYSFDKRSVDPDSIIKNKKFDHNFQINLYFSDVCRSECKPSKPLCQLCNDCKIAMDDEFKEWMVITNIVENHYIRLSEIAEKMKIKGKDQGQRVSKMMFKEIGSRINFESIDRNDYLKIIKRHETLIVCEDLSRNHGN